MPRCNGLVEEQGRKTTTCENCDNWSVLRYFEYGISRRMQTRRPGEKVQCRSFHCGDDKAMRGTIGMQLLNTNCHVQTSPTSCLPEQIHMCIFI